MHISAFLSIKRLFYAKIIAFDCPRIEGSGQLFSLISAKNRSFRRSVVKIPFECQYWPFICYKRYLNLIFVFYRMCKRENCSKNRVHEPLWAANDAKSRHFQFGEPYFVLKFAYFRGVSCTWGICCHGNQRPWGVMWYIKIIVFSYIFEK